MRVVRPRMRGAELDTALPVEHSKHEKGGGENKCEYFHARHYHFRSGESCEKPTKDRAELYRERAGYLFHKQKSHIRYLSLIRKHLSEPSGCAHFPTAFS
jgi:hypothetical protein